MVISAGQTETALLRIFNKQLTVLLDAVRKYIKKIKTVKLSLFHILYFKEFIIFCKFFILFSSFIAATQ